MRNDRFGWSALAWCGLAMFGTLIASALRAPDYGLSPERRQAGAVEAAHFRAYRSDGGPNAVHPPNALMDAMSRRQEMLDQAMTQGAGIYPGGWSWIGPGNIGGRLRAIAIHPTNFSIMWLGTAGGGIWKTTNGGASWFPVGDKLPVLSVSSLLLDRANANVLLAGTGEGFFETEDGTMNTSAIRGAGIFRTADGGDTWSQIPSTATPDFYHVNRLAQSPGDPNVILAATGTGIWRSTDGGNTWTRRTTDFTYDVDFHPTNGNLAVAGTHDLGAKYSTNGGVNWSSATGMSGHRTEIAYSKSVPTTVYAALSEADQTRVYRSTNGGQSFTLQSTSGISCYSAYNTALWVDPTNVNTVICGGVNMYRSTNAGVTLSQAFSGLHADMHLIIESPGFNGSSNRIVFFGTDGGIYRANDSNANAVTELNNQLGITQPYGAAMHAGSGVALIGNQDNGTARYTGNSEGWTSTFGGDGGYCASDPTNPNYFYGEVQRALVFRSTNGGQSANYIYNSGNPISDAGSSTNVNFIPYFMLDPNDPNRMLVCARRLWRSNNVKGQTPTWSIIKNAIGSSPGDDPRHDKYAHMLPSSPFNISTCAVAKGNSNIIFVGYNNGEIWKTTNGTQTTPTWTKVDDAGGPMPARWVSKIVVSPTDTNRIYVSLMGWSQDNVWRTLDGGATWQNVSGTGNGQLPAAPVQALAVHPGISGWLYAGTEIGLFVSHDDGATWTTSSQGPGNAPVEELHWVGQKLMCVTHGRGVFLAREIWHSGPKP